MNGVGFYHEALLNRRISAKELCREFLKRIHENDALNAYITVTDASAERAAEEADRRFSEKTASLLCGIPMALKDNLSTKGVRTTAASAMLKTYTPIYDAFCWEELAKEGAVLLGKLNMDEFAMGSRSDTGAFGSVKNPLDPTKSAGGSSGGCAAAVAAGLAVYALGSDTGGSVREPASHCGVVGFVPTYGAVSRFGLIAHASGLDRVGILSHTVGDARTVYAAICRRDERDMTCRGGKLAPAGELCGITVGLVPDMMKTCSSDIAAGVAAAADVLALAGCRITETALSHSDLANAAYRVIAASQASSNLARYDGVRFGTAEGTAEDTRTAFFGDEVKFRIMCGNMFLADGGAETYLAGALRAKRLIARDFEEAFRHADVLLCPTVEKTAPRFTDTDTSMLSSLTTPSSLAGLPAVTVPAGTSEEMPFGVQLIGKAFDEGTLLTVAEALERGMRR